MGVPFEALIPYGIVVVMFGVTGVGLSVVKTYANDGKKARWNRDLWDRVRTPRDPVSSAHLWLPCLYLGDLHRTKMANIPPANDGKRLETYRFPTRSIDKPGGAEGFRNQQPLEGRETPLLDLRSPPNRPSSPTSLKLFPVINLVHAVSQFLLVFTSCCTQRCEPFPLDPATSPEIGLGNTSYMHVFWGKYL
ncbi:hypothetical protein BDV09DRAFT_108471 [Aspergillus tetrazonus]